MRKVLLSLAAAATIAAATALAPAQAMTAGAAAGIQAALADISAPHEAAYVCRHRSKTSRRVCWWRPNWSPGWHWRRSRR
jgi:hypothetical protein